MEYFLEQPSLHIWLLLNHNKQKEWNWMWNVLFSSSEMSIWSYYNHQSSKQSWKGNYTSLQCQLIQTSQVRNVLNKNLRSYGNLFAMFKTIEIWEIANFIFLTLKEVGLHHFSHKISNIKLFPLKISKAVKVCLKNVLNVNMFSLYSSADLLAYTWDWEIQSVSKILLDDPGE